MKAMLRFIAGILLPCLILTNVVAQFGDNAKNGVDSKPEKYYTKAGVIPVNPYTGNIHLEIKDLELFGATGDMPMNWMRYGNSREGAYPHVFGMAHHWNASFMYHLVDSGVNVKGRRQIFIHYAEGGQNMFTQDSANSNIWLPLPGVDKRVFSDNDGFILQMANGFRYKFISIGGGKYQLHTITDSHQNVYTLEYDGERLVKVTEPAGRFFDISYKQINGNYVVSKVITKDGRFVQYSYSENGALIGATYGDNTAAVYEYVQQNNRPLLSYSYDPRTIYNATIMRYTYDPVKEGFMREQRNGDDDLMVTLSTDTANRTFCYRNNRVQTFHMPEVLLGYADSYIDGLGRETKYAYGNKGLGFLNAITDAKQRLTIFNKRTDYGNILELTNADNSTEKWTRDDLDLILSYRDELKRRTEYTRDAKHRIEKIDYPDNTSETFAYNDFAQVTIHTRKNLGTENSDYDTKGLLKTFIDAVGNSTGYGYNNNDLLKTITDARNNKTGYEYDERGLLTKMIHPDNSAISYGYNAFGNRIFTVNELGDTSHVTYDAFKRVVNRKAPLGRGTEYSYDLPGGITGNAHNMDKPSRITVATGKMTEMEYDEEWQRKSKTDGAGSANAATTQYEYDEVGNLEIMIDPRGFGWGYDYDLRDRRISTTDPLEHTTEWLYDSVGNVVAIIRPNGDSTLNSYDRMNRVKSSRDPKKQVTGFKYDAEGNMIQLKDPKGYNYVFRYDSLNRKTAMIYPGGSQENYTYDEVSNLKTYTNRNGDIRTYFYDNRDRDTLAIWDDNKTSPVRKDYDAASQLRTIENRASRITYVYNAANELHGEKQKLRGMPAKTLTYRNNQDGLRDTLVYPDGNIVRYKYTARNQVAAIYEGGEYAVAKYNYDENGNRIAKALENGTKTRYDYDEANRLLMVDNRKDSLSFAKFEYGYDDVNRRTYVKRNNAYGDVYDYDKIDQVANVHYDVQDPQINALNGAGIVHYDYDPNGNRITLKDNDSTTNYTTNNLNQYTSVDDSLLKYDNNGNLRKHNGFVYAYDAQNRLVRATDDTTIILFEYDALNRCVKRTTNGVALLFYYDGWNLIEERNASDEQLAKYIVGAQIDEILKRLAPGIAIIYQQHDGLGSVSALTNSTGNVIETYSYEVFGAPKVKDKNGIALTASAFGNRFMFTGREYLSDVALFDYRNRVFQPDLGRFLQTDPLQFHAGDANVYRYVGNNSTNFIDPFGTEKSVCQKIGEGAKKAWDEFWKWMQEKFKTKQEEEKTKQEQEKNKQEQEKQPYDWKGDGRGKQ